MTTRMHPADLRAILEAILAAPLMVNSPHKPDDLAAEIMQAAYEAHGQPKPVTALEAQLASFNQWENLLAAAAKETGWTCLEGNLQDWYGVLFAQLKGAKAELEELRAKLKAYTEAIFNTHGQVSLRSGYNWEYTSSPADVDVILRMADAQHLKRIKELEDALKLRDVWAENQAEVERQMGLEVDEQGASIADWKKLVADKVKEERERIIQALLTTPNPFAFYRWAEDKWVWGCEENLRKHLEPAP